ncbi:hypothetical protein KJ951_00930, partial [Patescibacteria group bacterium]|nr:hypothetical protein [Patescibacteria group bacterium]MBU1702943.1 hypothetical protein [Patescibacteria group bacterium]MBU1953733.1 hypothetical protein [Patescibacteria group bacterium]
FKYLVSNKATESAKEKIKGELQKSYSLSKEEFSILLEALRHLKLYYKNTRKNQHVQKEDLEKVLKELGQIEVLRREFPDTHNRFGLKGIRQLIDCIPNWIELISDAVENEHSSKHKRTILDSRAEALKMAIQQIAPMVMKRHRSIIRKRLKQYDKLKTIVQGVEDKEMNIVIRTLLGQISKILSYLDFMWEMHEVTEDQYSKRILYPQRMLRMTPLICREMEKLEAAFSWLAERLSLERTTFFPKTIRPAQSDFPLADDMEEQSQPGFVLSRTEEQIIIRKLADEFSGMIDDIFEPTNKADLQESKNQALASQFKMIASIIGDKLSKAKRYMQQTNYMTVELIHGYNEPYISVKDEERRLTNHVQDFITEARSAMMQAMLELVNAFDSEKNRRKDVMPEYEEYEKQAAGLRQQLEQLKKGSEKAKRMLDGILVKTLDGNESESDILQVKSALITIAESLKEFQKQQDNDIKEGKDYGVVKGHCYDLMSEFVKTVKEFFFERKCNQLNLKTLAHYALTRKLDQFAEQIENSQNQADQSGEVEKWLAAYKELKAIETEILAEQKDEESPEDRETAYRTKFMELIHGIKKIKFADTRFTRFLIDEPLSQRIDEEALDKDFFAFQKVMKQYYDFHTLISMSDDLVDRELLTDYDYRQKIKTTAAIAELIEELSAEKDNQQKTDTAKKKITECRKTAQEIQYTSPELADQLLMALDYIQKYTDYMGHYNEVTNMEDFATAVSVLEKVKSDLEKQLQ